MLKKFSITLLIGFACLLQVFSQNDGFSPSGRNTAEDLYAPFIAGRGGFTTSRGGSPASALNPAAEGESQRIIFDAGYLGLPRFGDDKDYGLGAFNLGAIFPTRYGVFGGSLWFLQSPNYFTEFPVGTTFQANLNAAKELYPGMSFGVGLNLGGNSEDAWSASADLGFRYNMGGLGPLENFTWALSARGLGKSWVPHAFTPAGGVAFDFYRIEGGADRADPLKVSLAADLMIPGFQNLAGKLGLNFLVAEFVNISTSTQFNIREGQEGRGPSPVPSIGIGVNLQLQSGGRRIVADRLPTDGDLLLSFAAKPLYDDIWAIGGGITWYVGVVDRTPPVITVNYPEPAWISPNNDGRADYLEFPISISDDRYVVEWVFEISDEAGNIVRVIRNRELRPETQGVENFISRVMAVKAMVEIPPTLRWDGIFDSGELAPDGKYFFTITAADDNGNTAVTRVFEVNVDNTPPDITLEPFVNDDNIFSPGGGGDKDTLTISQSGSAEDLWEGGIYDAHGNRIKTFNFVNSPPESIVWDGTDDGGEIVDDGIYTYRISAADRALNFSEASQGNIIVNTIRPVVGLSINNAFFSPNGDGVQDIQVFTLSVPVQEGIASWEFQIRDAQDELRRSYTGTALAPNIPGRIDFEGNDNTGRLLPEGNYRGLLSVRYRNGFTSTAVSPVFTLDITAPRAVVRADDVIFSPFNPDSPKTELNIYQESSKDITWLGEIRRRGDPSGSPLRTFRFAPGNFPAGIVWDGLSDTGSLVPDGFYTYMLSGTDLAGNSGRSNVIEFEVDTRDTPVVISTDLRAFSPSGNSPRTSLNLMPQLQERSGIASWRININDTATGALVRSFEGGETIPASLNWNGQNNAGSPAADGSYVASLEVLYRNGNRPSSQSLPFIIDTIPPRADVTTPFTIFAPNGNGNRETLPLNIIAEGNDEWLAVFTDSQNQVVRTETWTGRLENNSLVWDARDQAGNIVPDGTYTFRLSSTDEAGNSALINISNIVVDARVPRIFLTASSQAIAPRPGQGEAMRFGVLNSLQEGIESWRLDLVDEDLNVIRSFPSPLGGTGPIPADIIWNGANGNGVIQEGRFTPTLNVSYTKGDIVSAATPPVLVDISGPLLSYRSTPEYFSPDNDGVEDELFIYLSAIDPSPIAEWSLEFFETEGTRQLFYSINGRGSPAEEIIWDGRSNWGELVQGASDYRYVFRASDALGNSSSIEGIITTDVLVIRDGDLLRIMVPSIVFSPNAAHFRGIPQDRLENNERVLRRMVEILNRFRDYRITVEGHANPVLGTQVEELNVLQPLSLERARFIVEYLAGNGVNRNRLTAIGRGGTRTVAGALDQDNNWKNRRVEFILNR